MSLTEALPLLVLASSLLPGLVIFGLHEDHARLRTTLNLVGALGKLALIGYMLWGVAHGIVFSYRYSVFPGVELSLHADSLSLLFVTLSAALWLLTTLYAIGYLEGAPNRSRFFGFFSLCVTSTVGVAMAGNLFTFFFFYEMLTLSTYPLVVHRGTEASVRAGTWYLAYTLTGGAVLLTGVVWMYGLLGHVEFIPGGSASVLGPEDIPQLKIVFLLLIAGVGVKAALVPLHGWLPRAMVAPAPVSALLHAVAVVKAGAFGIVRVVYEVYGVEFAYGLGLLLPLAMIAAITILWGSVRALMQNDLKRRLAYSTVSQVSYIVLGVAIPSSIAAVGGLVHLVHQGVMKVTLFFCAGIYAETLGVRTVSELNGVGRRMPLTTLAFTLAALGMIGVPLTAGHVSKIWLSDGAHAAHMDWASTVLTISGFLNACYFLPMVFRAWFLRRRTPWPGGHLHVHGRAETNWLLLAPTLVGGVATVLLALISGYDWSPLSWARSTAAAEFLKR